MLIKPDDEFMLYRPSIDLADFYTESLCRVFEPFYDDAGNLDLDDISNSRIVFETTTNTNKDEVKFSNITAFDYIFEE